MSSCVWPRDLSHGRLGDELCIPETSKNFNGSGLEYKGLVLNIPLQFFRGAGDFDYITFEFRVISHETENYGTKI